jgi:uncharacterized protein YlxW (UPF0749 family)
MPDDSKMADYKSPLSKLANFFRTSRDNWKAKYAEAKYRAKLSADRARYWKSKAAGLQQRIDELERELSDSEKKTRKDPGK